MLNLVNAMADCSTYIQSTYILIDINLKLET